jgi:hypothetical protein
MDLVPLDRFMRSKRATLKVSLLFAASTILMFALAKSLRSPEHTFGRDDAAYLLGFAVVSGGFSALGVLAWRHLWRTGRTPAEAIVYNFGVRQCGIWAVLLSPLFALFIILALTGSVTGALLALFPLSVVVIAMMLPLGLWAGYILGYRRVGSRILQLGGIDERNMPAPVSESEARQTAA